MSNLFTRLITAQIGSRIVIIDEQPSIVVNSSKQAANAALDVFTEWLGSDGVVAVFVNHQRAVAGSCLCGWGAEHWGASFDQHLSDVLVHMANPPAVVPEGATS